MLDWNKTWILYFFQVKCVNNCKELAVLKSILQEEMVLQAQVWKLREKDFAALLYHQFHGQVTCPGYASIILPIKGGETS